MWYKVTGHVKSKILIRSYSKYIYFKFLEKKVLTSKILISMGDIIFSNHSYL